MDPENESIYQANHAVFVKEIVVLDRELEGIFSGHRGEPFMVFHPSWGYFAQAYGLKQIPIEIEGKEPKAAQLQKLIQVARKQHIRVVFAQPQFSPRNAEMIAREIGGRVVLVEPLAENWAENLRQAAREFKAALRKE
jgi:zinc transport system substrate-binding protein